MRVRFFSAFILSACFVFSFQVVRSQNLLTTEEKKCVKKFHELISFMLNPPAVSETITSSDSLNKAMHLDSLNVVSRKRDTAYKSYILQHFIVNPIRRYHLPTVEVDSTELPKNLYKKFEQELAIMQYWVTNEKRNKEIDNIEIIPLRLSKDKFVYQYMDDHERKYAYVYFNKKKPSVPLGFILFLPEKVGNSIDGPRMAGWGLMFRMNHFYFVDIFGIEGGGVYRLTPQ